MISEELPYSVPYRVAELASRKPTRFTQTPDAAALVRIATSIGIVSVNDLVMRGEIRPLGRNDWALDAQISATVTQDCVVTLAPVSTAVSEPVQRRYLSDIAEPVGEETETPEDDTVEALTDVIDVGAVMLEALALALPLYPRAKDAELGTTIFTEPGAEPLTDEALRPFAGLADLMKQTPDTE